MEKIKSELSLVLGETISRMETISERPGMQVFALYDTAGHAMPLVAKYFLHPGMAAQEARKFAMLAREGILKVPAVYGLVISQQKPPHEVLLMERLGGVSAEAPARNAARQQQLFHQVTEGLLAWHRIGSHGLVGTVDSTQENHWTAWYSQRVTVIQATLTHLNLPQFNAEDRRFLTHCQQKLPALLADFSDPCVLVHGNLTLRGILKHPHSDQLIAMVQPGPILWAPREYELFRLSSDSPEEALMFSYLRQAPVSDGFLWRRWLYLVWELVHELIHTGRFNRSRFDYARQQLLPWL